MASSRTVKGSTWTAPCPPKLDSKPDTKQDSEQVPRLRGAVKASHQGLECPGQSEPDDVAPEGRSFPVPVGRAKDLRIAVPRAAAQDTI